jgi:hypothetical protein
MRRKRLRHTAFTLCHIFSGWQLINSYLEIKQQGSGFYQYDLKNDLSFFNNEITKKLSIYIALEEFIKNEIERLNLNMIDFERIYFESEIIVNEEERKSKEFKETFIDTSGNEIKGTRWNDITFKCKTMIQTIDAQYDSELEGNVQWPEGWLKLSTSHNTLF